MAILTLQRRVAERGRIRFGEKRISKSGKEYPAALDHPRITSPDQDAVTRIAAVYGGEVKPWASPSGPQWQVEVEGDLRIGLLPVENLYSQHMEHWTAGGCDRRCNGVVEGLSGTPCICEAQGLEGPAACKPITRAAVVILGIGGFGTWRVETGSYYAAVEMGGVLDIARMAIENGMHVTGTLVIEHRRVVRPGKNGKPETRQYIVPVVRPDIDIEMLTDGTIPAAQIGAGGRTRLSPGERVPDGQPALPADTGGIPGADGPADLPVPPPLPPAGGGVIDEQAGRPVQPVFDTDAPDLRPITEGQRTRLFTIAGKSNVSEVDLRAIVKRHHGEESTKALTRDVYDKIVAEVQAARSEGGSDAPPSAGEAIEDLGGGIGRGTGGTAGLEAAPLASPTTSRRGNDPDDPSDVQDDLHPPIPGQVELA